MVDEFSLDKLEKGPCQKLLALKKGTNIVLNNNKPIILFGAGVGGLYYLKLIQRKSAVPILFCDNDPKKWDTTIEGVPVISFEELKNKYNDSYIVITSHNYYDEILSQLIEQGLQERVEAGFGVIFDNNYSDYHELVIRNINKFSEVFKNLSDELSKKIFYDRLNFCITGNSKFLIHLRSKTTQYFEPGIISLSDNETFIDGGAFTGDTIEEFIKQTNGGFKKIYSFEPEESKHSEFQRKFSETNNIELLPCGLWSKKEILRFNAENSGSSSVCENGCLEIPVISIDEVLNGKPVTFIKMDIEGAEIEALKGAEKTIKEHKPKLAICVYHKPMDIVEIPLYLKRLVPGYRLFIRHYGIHAHETVCYAVV